MYIDNVLIIAKGLLVEEALKKIGREVNQLARELRDLSLEIKPFKIKVIIFIKRGRKILTG